MVSFDHVPNADRGRSDRNCYNPDCFSQLLGARASRTIIASPNRPMGRFDR